MEDLFSTFSAYQFLMIRLTFWRSLRKSGNVNEPLAKIALWPVTLFYLYCGYYRKVLGQKFLHIFLTQILTHITHYINAAVLILFGHLAQ